jgi:hypothetical protein
MDFEGELEKALWSDAPGERLIEIASQFHQEGHDKREILELTIQFMLMLRSLGREKDEDLINDFCDYLEGYTARKPPF